MAEYVDYAEYYDWDTGPDVHPDIAFYLDYARASGSPILELACGTGRVLIPLAEAGFVVHGVDMSENMLAVCRAKVREHGLSDRVHLYHANMASFGLPRRDFALCYVPVRSFMHLFAQPDQIACLRRAHDHLLRGGRFIVDLYAPDYARLGQEPDQPFQLRKEYDLPNGRHVRRWDRFVRNDLVNQVVMYEMRFDEHDAAEDLVRQRVVPMHTRYTSRWEMQLLLERAGFVVEHVYGDYDRGEFDGKGEIICVARKA